MNTIENILFEESISSLRLELDFKNIPTKEYCEIILILKYCPSLVNNDIVAISEEIIWRIESMVFTLDKDTYKMIINLHSMLCKIPHTSKIINQLIVYCPWISKSPAVDPVVSPKAMKKANPVYKEPKIMKKARKKNDSPLKRNKHCPC